MNRINEVLLKILSVKIIDLKLTYKLKLAKELVVQSHLTFALADFDFHLSLPVSCCREHLQMKICSTTMKLRKSLVTPVMWQNISSFLVLLPEFVRLLGV